MRKNYILDSSTIIHDFDCFSVFTGNNVIIPIAVLEELDKIKSRPDFGGANARRAIRQIDNFVKTVKVLRKIINLFKTFKVYTCFFILWYLRIVHKMDGVVS